MLCILVWSSLSAEWVPTGYDCQSCSWSAEQGKCVFPCPHSRLIIWCRETGLAVPSRTSPLISTERTEHCPSSRDSSRFPWLRPSIYYLSIPSIAIIEGQSRVYRDKHLRTDGVYRRESAGTRPIVLKVARVTGAACSGNPMYQLMCAFLSHTHYRDGSGHVCVCVFFPLILDIKFVGRTSRGHTGGRSHRIFHPLSFCDACLNFSRENDSAIPFPRRPWSRILCTNDLIVLHPLAFLFFIFDMCETFFVSHIQRIGCQPEKTTLHGGQSRSWSAEQGIENKI